MNEVKVEQGSCLCGNISYEISGEPLGAAHCHCTQCRKFSGAGFLTWFMVTTENFKQTSGEIEYFNSSDKNKRGFCKNCGSSINYVNDEQQNFIILSAGTLDNAEIIKPAKHIYAKDQLSWADVGQTLPKNQEH